MGRVLVNYQELEALRNNPIIGSGTEGICYEYNKDYVLKIFNYLLLERKIFFEGLKSLDIAFPIDIYEYAQTGLIQGVLTNKFNGSNLVNGFKSDLEIDTLLAAYNRSRCELARFPDIKIDDISGSNLLFDYQDGAFKFIDTVNWQPSPNNTPLNLKKLDDRLMLSLTSRNLGWHEIPLIEDERVKSVYERWLNNYDIYDNEIFLEFLMELKGFQEEEKGKVKTIGELK